MMKTLAIAISAGVASALLYLAVTAGTLLAVPLFYLAVLPIMLVGLGWGTAAGWISAATGILTIAIATGPLFAGVYALACGLPAGFLSRLALLGRPVDGNGSTIEWYPAGRILIWCAGFGALVAIAAMALMGFDLSTIAGLFTEMMDRLSSAGAPATPLPEGFDREAFANTLAAMVPKAIAALWTATSALNLWLAARIAHRSGLLQRPLPNIADIELPSLGAGAIAIGFVMSMMGGSIALIGQTIMAAFITIYGLAGLMVVHVITLGNTFRPLILGALYGALLFLTGWVAMPLALLGLADSVFGLRRRSRSLVPPSSNSNQNDD